MVNNGNIPPLDNMCAALDDTRVYAIGSNNSIATGYLCVCGWGRALEQLESQYCRMVIGSLHLKNWNYSKLSNKEYKLFQAMK